MTVLSVVFRITVNDLYFSQEGTYNEQTRGEVRGIRTEDCVNLLRYVMGDTIPSFVEQADGTPCV